MYRFCRTSAASNFAVARLVGPRVGCARLEGSHRVRGKSVAPLHWFGFPRSSLRAACLRTQVMHGGPVATSKKLPSRPHLDHLRKQAKALLADLKQGDKAAIAAFVEHLPEAKRMSAARVKAAGFRLADAQ